MKIVYTAGVWDLLHRGHLNILWESRKLGDILVVGVVSDDGCEAYKGFRPAQYDRHRLQMIERLPWVDVAEFQLTTDPSPLLERYRPDIMTHGDDWAELREGQETIERLGIEWRLIPYTQGISSSQVRAAINELVGTTKEA